MTTEISTLNAADLAHASLKKVATPRMITVMVEDTINLSQIHYENLGAVLISDETIIGRIIINNGVLSLELNEDAPYLTLIGFPEHANIVIDAINDIAIQVSRALSLSSLNVQAKNIDWSGTIHTEQEMRCVAREQLSLHGKSAPDTMFCQFSSGQFEAQQIVVSGKSDYQNVKFIADAFECSSDATQYFQSCNFQISGPIILPEGAQMTVLKSELNADSLHLLGNAKIEDCGTIQTDICVTSKQCSLISSNLLASKIFQDEGALIDHCMIRAASISLNNETSIHNASELVANILNVQGTGLIENSVVLVNQYLYTTEDCGLTFKNAVLETDQSYAQGQLKFIENGCHRTNYLQQKGGEITVGDGASVLTGDSLTLKESGAAANHMTDSGALNAKKQSTLHALVDVMNRLGSLASNDPLSSDSAVYYIFGLESAYDFNFRDLYPFNLGLFLPALTQSLEDVFTYSRLTSFARMGLTNLFPAYRHRIALGWMVMPYAQRTAEFVMAPYIDMIKAHIQSEDTLADLPHKIYDVTRASVESAQDQIPSISMLKQLPGKIYDEVSKKWEEVDTSDTLPFLVSGLSIALSTAQYVWLIRGAYSELTAPKMVQVEAVASTFGETLDESSKLRRSEHSINDSVSELPELAATATNNELDSNVSPEAPTVVNDRQRKLGRVGMFKSLRAGNDGVDQAEQDRQREREHYDRCLDECKETQKRWEQRDREQRDRERERAYDRRVRDDERREREDGHLSQVGMFKSPMFTDLRAGSDEREQQDHERDWEERRYQRDRRVQEQKNYQREQDKKLRDEAESERNRKEQQREWESNQKRLRDEQDRNPPQTDRDRQWQEAMDEGRRHIFGY